MASITLKDGDFGSNVAATVDDTALYLPDPARPGAVVMVALADVAEIESVADDHSGRLAAAAKLSARGFMAAGPVGLAAGLLGAARAKDVVFSVHLKDGRQFTASAGASIYADLRAAKFGFRFDEPGAAAADEIVAKYLAVRDRDASSGGPAADVLPAPAAPKPAPAPAPSPPAVTRPVFGKRGR